MFVTWLNRALSYAKKLAVIIIVKAKITIMFNMAVIGFIIIIGLWVTCC